MTAADKRPRTRDTGDGTVPRYAQVAERLREQIACGRLAEGQRLGGELELAREWGVSRITIRNALALLKREGLIVTRHGRGSFVRAPRVRQILGRLETLDDSLAEQGLASATRILDFRFGQPTAVARTALALPAGAEVLMVERVHLVAEEPLALVRMAIPAGIGAHFSRRDVEEHPLYELLPARLGIAIGAATQTLRAAAADAAGARALLLAERAPVLVCERVTHAEGGEPLIYTLFTYRADRFEFRVTLARHDWPVPWLPPGLIGPAPAEAAIPRATGDSDPAG
jgi:GntR family transcriptional regulator